MLSADAHLCGIGGVPPADVHSPAVPEGDGGGDGRGERRHRPLRERQALSHDLHVRLDLEAALAACQERRLV